MARQNYKIHETTAEATARLGKWGRFLVWNNEVYAFESFKPLAIAPIKQYSSYAYHQAILDFVSAKLSQSKSGSWVYVRERENWYRLPLSAAEIQAISNFDLSVMDYQLISTPPQPVFPI